ncbi:MULTISPECIES: TIM barrel protein [Arthrobacter]|uniref:TIM barrel protein n=2 Tax=Arthrobacter TaxID=1663 RepID=A0ABU9KMU0_9MICC|nr:TIM barrel protein [Arthrobacter sp. YJM1]MDP5228061.1 TIM barrel protein [Arthrobacter sp. YJM1]
MTQITSVQPGSGVEDGAVSPQIRIGAQFTRYPELEDQPLIESLHTAVTDGFQLVVLNNIAAELAADGPDGLDEVAAEAAGAGTELQLGLGCAGPFGDPQTLRASLRQAMNRGLELGIREFFVYTRSERDGGMEAGRFLDHPAQLRNILATLNAIAPEAEAAGARINVKTHEDLASGEVLALVERLDPAVFAIGLDVANLVVRGEDPQAVAQKLGPRIRMTHLEDLVLFPVPDGYRRRLRAVGEGVLDWNTLLGTLLDAGVRDFTLEQHRGRFDTPVFDRSWFAHEPHLDAADLGQLARLGVLTHDGAAQGRFPVLQDWDEEPTPGERRRQMLHSTATLRSVLTSIGATVASPSTVLSREEGKQ